ncbi:MAG: hypothetical protein J3K34DRAFT_415443 [Monoraphidium minutum]|nr:MAG: hypothetical protein J3K34DRAFT_415443 [Monoraphidium minutum]
MHPSLGRAPACPPGVAAGGPLPALCGLKCGDQVASRKHGRGLCEPGGGRLPAARGANRWICRLYSVGTRRARLKAAAAGGPPPRGEENAEGMRRGRRAPSGRKRVSEAAMRGGGRGAQGEMRHNRPGVAVCASLGAAGRAQPRRRAQCRRVLPPSSDGGGACVARASGDVPITGAWREQSGSHAVPAGSAGGRAAGHER